MGVDDGLPGAGTVGAVPEDVRARPDRDYSGVERGELRGRVGEGLDHPRGQLLLAREEHLALVGEVPEEGPFGDSGPGRDLRDGGLLEAALGEELEGRALQATLRSRHPPTHASHHSDVSD